MTRRNTIIVAVIVNAILLTLLFTTAVTHEDEYYAKSSLLDKAEKQVVSPLLNEPKAVQEPLSIASLAPAMSEPLKIAEVPKEPMAIVSLSEDKVIHQLPMPVGENKAEAVETSIKELPKYKEVVVKKGDSLEKLAKAHKVPLEELIKLNNLPNSFLRIGQVIKLPTMGSSPAKTTDAKVNSKIEASSEYYVVKAGDNPWTIAMKHHLKVDELLKINHLDKEKAKRLKPGDKLRIR